MVGGMRQTAPKREWLLAMITGMMAMNGLVGASTAQNKPVQKEILKLEKIIALPHSSVSAAWAPDSRRILVDGAYSYKPEAFVIDVESEKFSDPITTLNTGINDLYWSPDEKHIVVTRKNIIRVLTYPDFKQVKEKWAKDVGCPYAERRGAVFTRDGKAMWLHCQGRLEYEGDKYLAAVKLSIPELEVVDHFMAPVPEPGEKVHMLSNIAAQGGEIVLNSVILVGDVGKGNGYFASYGLKAKKVLYPAFKSSKVGVKGSVLQAIDYSLTSGALVAAIEGIEVKNATIFVTSGDLVEVQSIEQNVLSRDSIYASVTSARISCPIISRYRRFLIAVVQKRRDNKTTSQNRSLAIWSIPGLKLVQELRSIPPFYWMGLSPDGTRFVGLKGNELYIYSVAE